MTKKLELEAKVQLTEQGQYFVDGGLKFAYEHNTSTGADEVAASLLLAKDIAQTSNVANFKIAKEVGEDSADNESYEFKFKSKYRYSPDFDFGVEYYADFGDTTGD